MSLEKKIYLYTLLVIVSLVGVFATADYVFAQSDCCVQRVQNYQFRRTSERSGFLWLDKQTFESFPETIGLNSPQGCYILQQGAACNGTKVKTEESCEDGPDDAEICTYAEVAEEAAACDAFPICFSKLDQESQCGNLNAAGCRRSRACFWDDTKCQSRFDASICSRLNQKFCGSADGSQACSWNKELGACITKLEGQLGGNRANESDILPDCAVQGNCRSLNDLVQVAINVARKLFGLIGSAAFLMFIYGGVVMVASFGNTERFQKGKQVLTAAIVGIIIAFGAFMLIGYVLSIVGVDSDLRANVNVGTE